MKRLSKVRQSTLFVAIALACASGAAGADDVKVTPPAGGGFSVTDSGGGAVRLRVD